MVSSERIALGVLGIDQLLDVMPDGFRRMRPRHRRRNAIEGGEEIFQFERAAIGRQCICWAVTREHGRFVHLDRVRHPLSD